MHYLFMNRAAYCSDCFPTVLVLPASESHSSSHPAYPAYRLGNALHRGEELRQAILMHEHGWCCATPLDGQQGQLLAQATHMPIVGLVYSSLLFYCSCCPSRAHHRRLLWSGRSCLMPAQCIELWLTPAKQPIAWTCGSQAVAC